MTYTLLRTAVWMSTWFLLERRFNSLKITHKWNSSGWCICISHLLFSLFTWIVLLLLRSALFDREEVTKCLAHTWQPPCWFVHLIVSAILSQTFSQTNIPSHSRTKKFLQFSLLRQQDKNLMRFSRQALIPPSTRATLKSFGDVFAKSCNQCRCK